MYIQHVQVWKIINVNIRAFFDLSEKHNLIDYYIPLNFLAIFI
jgi:hypothetical protein